MPSRSSRSTSRSDRRGFTLLEIAISTALMGLVFAIVMQAFVGARKSQGMAVSTSVLKHEGQRTMRQMLLELGQARKLLGSQVNAPATEDIGFQYFKAIDNLVTHQPPLADTLLDFPRIAPNGQYDNVGGIDLPHSAFGNALIFVKRDSELLITGETILIGASLTPRMLTEEKPFRLGVYRFVAYYLGTRDLPRNAPPLNGTWNQALALVRFESKPYLEKSETWGFLKRLADPPARTLAYITKLNKTADGEAIVGCWDSNEINPDNAFFKYDESTDSMIKVPGFVRGKRSRPLTQFPTEPYAVGTVSFNAGSNYPNFKVAGTRDGTPAFVVPAFALDPLAASPTEVPYGFEVGITGNNSGRLLMLRLALAARITAGNHLYGHIHQQSVQVFDN